MEVTVKYMAQVRLAAQRPSEKVTLDEALTLREFLAHLGERHGEPMRKLLFDAQGGIQNTLLIFKGEEQVRLDNLVSLQDGDVVTLLTPIAGG